MAINAELFDGTILEFPDGTDPSVIQQTAKRITDEKQSANEGDFMRGLKSYFPSIKETLGGAQVLAGKALGSEDIMRGGVERVRGAQAEQKGKETDDLTAAWDKGIGAVLTDWLPYQIGSGVGNVAESVAMAGVGSLFGGVVGGAGGVFAKQLIKKGIKEAAKDVIEEQIAKGATKEVAREAGEKFIAEMGAKELEENAAKFLAKQGGKAYGLTAGLGAQALTHGMGETTSRALQEADMDPTKIDLGTLLPAAGVHSIADFISEKVMLGGLRGMDLGGLSQKSTGKMLYDVLKGVSLTGLKEIPPETLQSAAERYGAKLPLTSAEAMSEYINTAGAAFAMSILPGGIGGVQTRMRGTPEERKAAYEQAAKDLGQLDTGIPTEEGAGIRELEQPMEVGLGIPQPDFAAEERPAPEVRPAPAASVPPVQTAPAPEVTPAPEVAPAPEITPPAVQEAPPVVEPTPAPVAEPVAPQEPVQSNWPEDIPKGLFRGYGREDQGAAYGSVVAPIAGRAKYFAFDQDTASEFGPNIETAEAPLNNPFVIRDGDEWRNLTKEAGWPNPNPFSMSTKNVEKLTENLQGLLKERGYDGMIVYWDHQSPYDIGPNGENYKTLNNVFGVPQAVVFEQEQKPATKPEEKPAAEAQPHPLENPQATREQKNQAIEDAGRNGINLVSRGNKIDLNDSTFDWDRLAKMKTAGQAMQQMRDHVPMDYRAIIDRIMPAIKDIPISINRRVTKSYGGQHTANVISGDQNIQYARKVYYGNTLETVLHEVIHGATVVNYLRGHRNIDPRYTAAAKEMDELAAYIRKHAPRNAVPFLHSTSYTRSQWGMELIARAMTERDVQDALKNIKMPNQKTAWSKFVELVCKFLDIKPGEQNAMSRLLEISEKFMEPVEKHAGKGKSVGMPSVKEDTVVMNSVSPHKNYAGGKAPDATWGLRPYADMSARSRIMDDLIYKYLDKHKDLKDIINAIKAANRKVTATWDAYMKETLYHNRVAYLSKMFVNNELKPLAEAMVKAGVTEPELNNFLLARHAEEYNEEINRRNDNPAVQNRGSGVHTLVARAYMGLLTPQQVQAIANSKDLNENEKKLMADLKSMTPEKRAKLAKIAERVDSIIRRTQDMTVAGGIEKQTTIDYWRDKYPNYAPLKRDPDELDFVASNLGMGAGFSTRAGFGKAAVGSLKGIDNILSNIVLQRDMSIMRAEKARIGRALYGLFLQNPNPGFVLPVNPNVAVVSKANELYAKIQMDERKLEALQKRIEDNQINGIEDVPLMKEAQALSDRIVEDTQRHLSLQRQAEQAQKILIQELVDNGIDKAAAENLIKEPEGAFYNPKTGKVEYRTNAYLRSMPNVLAIPIDGETRYLFFNPADERAMRMVKSLKNLDVEKIGEITATIAKFTRWIAMVNTQYNPFFGILNMMRDVQGAQFNLTTTALRGQQMAVNSHIMPSLFAIYNSLRGERAGKQYQDGVTGGKVFSYADKWNEFQKFGGPTGFKDMLARDRDQISVLQEEIARLQEKPGKQMSRRAFDAVVGRLADFNDSMENAVRLSAFIEAQKKFTAEGMTYEQASEKAAELAKNLTVNFNRKGQKSQLVNSWYAFFNASAQGASRLIETVNGPAGRKIMSGLILMGVMQSLLLKAADFDDDDPPAFVREKNFIIPTGDGKYLSLPLPLGFNLFVNFGRLSSDSVADVMFNGGRNMPKNITNMASVISNTFNPFGSSGLSIQTLAPTIADPMAALAENKDAFGRPIYREDRATNPTPGYLRSRDSTFGISKFLAEAMNRMSGGTEFQKGYISPTADEIEYLAGQLGGGVWREGRKLMGFAGDITTGEETAPYKIPLAGRFYGDTGSNANISNRFYENVTELAKYEQEIKGRAKSGQEYQSFMESHPGAMLFQSANRVENTISKLNKTRKALIESGAPKSQIKQVDDYKIQIMKQFNDAVASAVKS